MPPPRGKEKQQSLLDDDAGTVGYPRRRGDSRAALPPERLLVYEVQQGREPSDVGRGGRIAPICCRRTDCIATRSERR
jgi:hypothetical protein